MLYKNLKSKLFRTISSLTVTGMVLAGVAAMAFALSSPQAARADGTTPPPTTLPVFATEPEFITMPVDVTRELGACDGFTVIEHVEGTIKISTHFDQDGNLLMGINRIRLRDTFTNSVTGESLSSPDVGIDRFTISQDGSETRASIGLLRHIVVPSEGITFPAMGKIVFNLTTGEVEFVAGPHGDFEEFLPALCSALG
jgi:hypothetical protein